MAFSDPQSITIDTDPVSLPRIGTSMNEGAFSSGDLGYKLTIGHTASKRNRHVVKLQASKIVSDPLVPSVNTPVQFSAHLVLDGPRNGVTPEELVEIANALVAWSTNGNLTKLAGNEV